MKINLRPFKDFQDLRGHPDVGRRTRGDGAKG